MYTVEKQHAKNEKLTISTISMTMLNSYIKLPEGSNHDVTMTI